MPIPLIAIAIGIGMFATGAVVAVYRYWGQILDWAKSTCLPWLEQRNPRLAAIAERAFMNLHTAISTVRAAIKEAWQELRSYLVRMVVELSRDSSSEWVMRTTSWVLAALGPDGTPQFEEKVTTRPLAPHDIPADLLKDWMRRRDEALTIDVIELRDQEVMELDLDTDDDR
jgi:hypothetical protein